MAEKKAVIIGAHGKIALLAAPRLVEAGYAVDGLIRNPDHATDVSATGATPVELSLEDASVDDLAQAFAGTDAVVFSAGAGGGNPARTIAVDRDAAIRSIDAAATAGVARYVLVSYQGAGRINPVPETDSFYTYQEAKVAADTHLRGTDLGWTIAGPGSLTLDPSPHGVTPAVPAGEPLPSSRATSRALVAEVIAAALVDDRSARQTLDFTDGSLPLDEWIGGVAAGEIPGTQN
jgi:uncharacterized protein YbjT (DUF2867 family)